MSDFKNILWIEDDKTKDIAIFFGKLSSSVKRINTFTGAFQEITGNVSNYDLVVFDLNLENADDVQNDFMDDEYYNNIKEQFEKRGVILPSMAVNDNNVDGYEDNRFKAFQKECGIYLYLLLLNEGFPRNRMVILTGNKSDAEKLLREHRLLSSEKVIEKNSGDNDLISDSKYYGENSSFYAVRRLVFRAVQYWEDELANKKEDDIAFNKLYFKPGQGYNKDSFIALMNEVKLLFENMVPSDVDNLYYHAMHIFAGFHEEKAKINNLSKSKSALYPYHSMIRFFRNWSSHNLFEANALSADEFALLFCIALRTYFDEKQIDKGKAFSEDLFAYEDQYFDNVKLNITTTTQEQKELAEQVLQQVSIPMELNCDTRNNATKTFAEVLANKSLKENARLQNIFCLLIDCKIYFSITYQIVNANQTTIQTGSGPISLELQSSGTGGTSTCDRQFRNIAAELMHRRLNKIGQP